MAPSSNWGLKWLNKRVNEIINRTTGERDHSMKFTGKLGQRQTATGKTEHTQTERGMLSVHNGF